MTIDVPHSLPIVFLSPGCLLRGREDRSKLLDPSSDLYRCLSAVRGALSELSRPAQQRMDFHVELSHVKNTDPGVIHKRVRELCSFPGGARVTSPESLEFWGGAFVLVTPNVSGYGKTHITIAAYGARYIPDKEAAVRVAVNAAETFLRDLRG